MPEIEKNKEAEKSLLFEQAKGLSPLFSSSDEAVRNYVKKLEGLSAKYEKSLDALVQWAESENDGNYDDDQILVMSLVRKIKVLQEL